MRTALRDGRRKAGPPATEAAISSVVGTILMLVITVTVFAGISVGVTAYFEQQESPPRVDIGIVQEGSRLMILHRGGDPIPLGSGSLLVTTDSGQDRILMDNDAVADQTGDGTHLRIGDGICIRGDPPCLYGTSVDITSVGMVVAEVLIAHHSDINPGGS